MNIETIRWRNGTDHVTFRLVVSDEEAIDLVRYDLDKRIVVVGSTGVIRVHDLLQEPVSSSGLGWHSSLERLETYVRHALRLIADDLVVAQREDRAMAALLWRSRMCREAHVH